MASPRVCRTDQFRPLFSQIPVQRVYARTPLTQPVPKIRLTLLALSVCYYHLSSLPAGSADRSCVDINRDLITATAAISGIGSILFGYVQN
jgi:hypothetical protein